MALSGRGPLSLASAAVAQGGSVVRREPRWTKPIVVLVLVVWLIPIKSYKLPIGLPFNLEIYRLVIILLGAAWLVCLALGSAQVSTGGRARVLGALVVGAVASLAVNLSAIDSAGLQTQAVKSLSFFLSYVLAFVLVSSLIREVDDVVKVVQALVLGAAAVAAAALWESRMHVNLFDHLHSVLPFLVHFGRSNQNVNGGALRVRASAQHPIALGCALTMCVPLALHLSTRAATAAHRRLWLAAAGLVLLGAMATVSRTVILMLLAMLVCAFWLYGTRLLRYWPMLLILAVATHFAAPGVVSHIYKRFTPKGGVVGQLDSRAGMRGSGRIADLGPGLSDWLKSPLVGHGLGTVAATGDSLAATPTSAVAGPPIIFDDQYMNTLVSLGAVGLISVLVFIWGSVRRLGTAARRTAGQDGALLAACAVSAAGFGAGMATFDAFTFVQATLVFFIIVALGLRVRAAAAEA
ncbi:MAG TPA: O-antigen ligase family protein [Gaiellaceae bacterium]|nr:O-antigen ligase family protein [Gaiellaceae bacterium]